MKKLTALLIVCLLVSACGVSTRNQAEKYNQQFMAGNYQAACETMTKESFCKSRITEEQQEKVNKWELDDALNAATAMFGDKKYENSSKVFDEKSSEIIKKQSESIGKNIAKSSVEIIGNASLLGYSPYIMDGVYTSAYQILNSYALNDKHGARIEANRAYEKQKIAASLLEKQIQKQQHENDKNNVSKKQVEQVLGEYADLAKWYGYKNFLNPYVTYLSGLVFLTQAQSASDYETAATYLKRVLGMMNTNSVVLDDLKSAENAANGMGLPQQSTWIIYENGLVANLKEFRIDLPIFLVSKDVQTASLALPRPQERDAAYSTIYAQSSAQHTNTELLADVDSMFIAEFNKRFPTIITKAIIKLTAQTVAQAAAKKNLGIWGSIGAAAYSVVTAGADLRSWYSLPKNVQLSKLPKTGKAENISLLSDTGEQLGTVAVPAEGNHLIYVRVPAKGAKPSISLLTL